SSHDYLVWDKSGISKNTYIPVSYSSGCPHSFGVYFAIDVAHLMDRWRIYGEPLLRAPPLPAARKTAGKKAGAHGVVPVRLMLEQVALLVNKGWSFHPKNRLQTIASTFGLVWTDAVDLKIETKADVSPPPSKTWGPPMARAERARCRVFADLWERG